MYQKIQEFIADYRAESALTRKVLAGITDQSLPVKIGNSATLGEVAWHFSDSLTAILSQTGLLEKAREEAPTSASKIREAYSQRADEVLTKVQELWGDASLVEVDNMYGMQWAKGHTLQVVVRHEIHHRGQFTMLLRAAGLPVPGTYGPSGDER